MVSMSKRCFIKLLLLTLALLFVSFPAVVVMAEDSEDAAAAEEKQQHQRQQEDAAAAADREQQEARAAETEERIRAEAAAHHAAAEAAAAAAAALEAEQLKASSSLLTSVKSKITGAVDQVVDKSKKVLDRCKSMDKADVKKVAAAVVGVWGVAVGVGYLTQPGGVMAAVVGGAGKK